MISRLFLCMHLFAVLLAAPCLFSMSQISQGGQITHAGSGSSIYDFPPSDDESRETQELD